MKLSITVAVSENGVIGSGHKQPLHPLLWNSSSASNYIPGLYDYYGKENKEQRRLVPD